MTPKYTQTTTYYSKARQKDESRLGVWDNCMTEQLCGKYYLYYE